MSDGKKKVDEFKKLWDKGLAVQLLNPNEGTQRSLRIRQQFEKLNNRDPAFGRMVMEHPNVKSAQKNLEKAVSDMEKAMQGKDSK